MVGVLIPQGRLYMYLQYLTLTQRIISLDGWVILKIIPEVLIIP